jgi:hypothetical protein
MGGFEWNSCPALGTLAIQIGRFMRAGRFTDSILHTNHCSRLSPDEITLARHGFDLKRTTQGLQE